MSEEILRRRAAELASRESGEESREPLTDVVLVRRCSLTLAVPLTAAREVRQVRVARFPVGQRVVSGLFQVRGRTDCLVDLAALLEETKAVPHGGETLALIVSGSIGDLGLRIDEVLGARRLYSDEVADDVPGREWVRLVTVNNVHLIDVDGLMACPDLRLGGDRPVPE